MITRYTRKGLRAQSLQAEASDSTGLFRFTPLRHFSGSAHRFSEASTAATLGHLNSQGMCEYVSIKQTERLASQMKMQIVPHVLPQAP